MKTHFNSKKEEKKHNKYFPSTEICISKIKQYINQFRIISNYRYYNVFQIFPHKAHGKDEDTYVVSLSAQLLFGSCAFHISADDFFSSSREIGSLWCCFLVSGHIFHVPFFVKCFTLCSCSTFRFLKILWSTVPHSWFLFQLEGHLLT